LAGKGRLEWVGEEGEGGAAVERARRGREGDAGQKVKGVRRLSRREQAVLRAAFAWREGVAERTDIPAFKIVSTETLLDLAARHPASAEELRRTKGLSPRVLRESATLLEAIGSAWALPAGELPR